jgi:DNA-binding NarL/FixJ family response regulator
MTIRIVVADDHAVVREGLRALISTISEYELVGTAATPQEAVRAAVSLKPHVVIMDVAMPDGSGVDAAREISRAAPEVGVLMLTMYDDDDTVFAAMRSGALGYVLKGANPDEIIRAIAAVAHGEAIFSPAVARRALTLITDPPPLGPPFAGLTQREREVLELVATGLGNATIATRLHVSPNTVANHISAIFRKLQVSTRPEAIARARDAGLAAT